MKILILSLLLFLSDCTKPDYVTSNDKFYGIGDFEITYIKDTRTNVCFAMMGSDTRTITATPCTPEVEKLINKPIDKTS